MHARCAATLQASNRRASDLSSHGVDSRTWHCQLNSAARRLSRRWDLRAAAAQPAARSCPFPRRRLCWQRPRPDGGKCTCIFLAASPSRPHARTARKAQLESTCRRWTAAADLCCSEMQYPLLMRLLSDGGYTVVATPYAVTFQHAECALAVQQVGAPLP